MNNFSCFGLNNFYLALGYKLENSRIFYKLPLFKFGFRVNLSSGKIKPLNEVENGWNVSLIDTGLKTMTEAVKKSFSYEKRKIHLNLWRCIK